MNDRELADELDAEVKNERSGKIANLMMRASAALRRSQPEGMVMVPKPDAVAPVGKQSVQLSYFGGNRDEVIALLRKP